VVRIVEWWDFDHVFHTDMRVLPLGVFDAILGYDWLRKHSPMQCDWERKMLQVVDEGVEVSLWGYGVEKQNVVQDVSMLQVNKWLCSNDIWAFCIARICAGKEEGNKEGEIQQLLQEIKTYLLCQNTPPRPYDHHIPLVPRSMPTNVKPYRYSPFHKDEIERQVVSLLEARLIVLSVSHFASPVLLVKKDDTWRFCVDYRKLNDLIIKNRFPMPLVEEFLVELVRTNYFSSLDLTAGYTI
jgi:hypothetical protein